MSDVKPVRAETKPPSLEQVIGRIAETIDKLLPPGDVAELRRLKQGTFSPSFFKIIAGNLSLIQSWPAQGPSRDDYEYRWGVILQAMAKLKGLHKLTESLGKTLAREGYSELRFVRLLRSHDNALAHEIRTCAQFLAAKSSACNQVDLAYLVLSDKRMDAETIRRRIARSYYSKSHSQEDKS